MARLARVVLPYYPHHITQRGNRRQDVFFNDDDYQAYLSLLKQRCRKEGIEIWAYCLMTNHVHLVVVPNKRSNLAKAIGETHRRYTCMINARYHWTGYLWQGRFASFPMDTLYTLKAIAYVELNPVKAGIVKNAWDYKYSSADAHLTGKDELGIVEIDKVLDITGNYQDYLQQAQNDNDIKILEKHQRTGRPLGDESFISKAEKLLKRHFIKKKAGPRIKSKSKK